MKRAREKIRQQMYAERREKSTKIKELRFVLPTFKKVVDLKIAERYRLPLLLLPYIHYNLFLPRCSCTFSSE
jgi:hypothetical protein